MNDKRPPPMEPKKPLSMLATLAVTAGVVAFGVYALDLHTHTCNKCGHLWRHLGAFNLGDAKSHTCAHCGEVQWWKNGAPHVMYGAQAAGPGNSVETLPLHTVYGRPPSWEVYPQVLPNRQLITPPDEEDRYRRRSERYVRNSSSFPQDAFHDSRRMFEQNEEEYYAPEDDYEQDPYEQDLYEPQDEFADDMNAGLYEQNDPRVTYVRAHEHEPHVARARVQRSLPMRANHMPARGQMYAGEVVQRRRLAPVSHARRMLMPGRED